MSREFGSYEAGYFHQQMRTGADDCLRGRDPLTKLWGSFLEEFADIAYAIASSEAYDAGPDYTIIKTLDRLPSLKRKLSEIELFTEPFRRVAEDAVRALARPKAEAQHKDSIGERG